MAQSEFDRGRELGWQEAITLLQTGSRSFVGRLPDEFRQALIEHDMVIHQQGFNNGFDGAEQAAFIRERDFLTKVAK